MYMRSSGFSIYYQIFGQGTPMLLIHAFPLNSLMWEPQITTLKDESQLIIPDMRGFGKSDQPPGAYPMDDMADDCMNLLEDAGVDQRVIVAGLSMGGYVTLAFYRKYSHKVKGLILAGTRASADTPEGKLKREQSAEKAQEIGVEAVVADMLPKMMAPKTYITKPELVAHVERLMNNASVNGVVGALLGMKERLDSQDLLPQISVPTLILHGADDQLISSHVTEEMHAAIRDSRLMIVPDAGHLLNLEQPQVFNQAAREFIRSI